MERQQQQPKRSRAQRQSLPQTPKLTVPLGPQEDDIAPIRDFQKCPRHGVYMGDKCPLC